MGALPGDGGGGKEQQQPELRSSSSAAGDFGFGFALAFFAFVFLRFGGGLSCFFGCVFRFFVDLAAGFFGTPFCLSLLRRHIFS